MSAKPELTSWEDGDGTGLAVSQEPINRTLDVSPQPKIMEIPLWSPFSAASPRLHPLLRAPQPVSPFPAQRPSTMASPPPGIVRATIQHLAPLDKYQNEKPFKIMLDVSGLGQPQPNYELLEATVDVIDAQPTRDQWSMQANGFQFLSAPSQLQDDDFDDEAQVKNRYYQEVISAVQRLFPPGAEVHVLGYQVCSDTCGSPLSNIICPLWRMTPTNMWRARGENQNRHLSPSPATLSPFHMPTLVRLCRPSLDAVYLHDKLTLLTLDYSPAGSATRCRDLFSQRPDLRHRPFQIIQPVQGTHHPSRYLLTTTPPQTLASHKRAKPRLAARRLRLPDHRRGPRHRRGRRGPPPPRRRARSAVPSPGPSVVLSRRPGGGGCDCVSAFGVEGLCGFLFVDRPSIVHRGMGRTIASSFATCLV